jgi:catechol 2,3-dioxygenase-like lactoylglutathione lyase family enzyme
VACRITELVLDCRDPERLAAFWCEVLGWKVLDKEDGSVEIGPEGGESGSQPVMVLSATDEPKRDKLRLHLDVNATDRDQAEELARLLAIGARPADVGQTGEESWHVLADPEGNEFCLLRRRLAPVPDQESDRTSTASG